ncbi:mitotic-spindle organizing protein 1 [Gamsiella multidivaricata]|uniref:mitotic-spindle organizing protein 1 n=1 Tax=Gamsiella multidivaricata TaxID=101098 RepID=UPI002220E2C0|nr:mitotic-spindle organizing protein 1 [Gamsiella multidivaricata]KAI7816396.1 mitotic-spindle organizing protein 1 [Gamsiella multidivaricata]
MQDSTREQQRRQQCQQQEARQAMDILAEMSSILNTGLDREMLSICVSLCESGVNPEALAAVIKELRRESATTRTGVA